MIRRMIQLIGSGIAGGLAWQAGMLVFFGPAQIVLASPSYQSGKLNAVFQTLAPLPRTHDQPWLLLPGLIGISCIYVVVYDSVRHALKGSVWRRAVRFGTILWAVMVPWFEFYLPWNVLHEPPLLVLLECLCWFGVMQFVALAIVASHQRLADADCDPQ